MAKSKLLNKINIELSHHQYPIYIGSGLIEDARFVATLTDSPQILVISNDIVARNYLKYIEQAYQDREVVTLLLNDGEEYKNIASLQQIYDTLLEHDFHRDATIIALGGGVIGDIAGFAAATYQRGIGLIQVPTTLLAQVDSSVGGKTAINHLNGKNMIGSFYQPNLVLIDIDVLQTLPKKIYYSGFAEIIKYAILVSDNLLPRLCESLKQGIDNITKAELCSIIAESCAIKAKVVEADEKEAGIRALLNLGHTFGHALETYTSYKKYLHGEAVAIGMYIAALLSTNLGLLDRKYLEDLDALFKFANLPSRLDKNVDCDKLYKLMFKDKKVKNNQIRFVLIKSPGNCFVREDVPELEVIKALKGAVEGATL